LVWEWYDWRRQLIGDCRPNAAHRTLVEMGRHFDDLTIVTQNVDGLHRLAGSRNVVELHGDIWRMRCTVGCQPSWEDRTSPLRELPVRCPRCGALARPDVVWFGEALPGAARDAAWLAAERCRLMLVIGTSALVQPAASLPVLAQQNGAFVVEINPQPTPVSELVDVAIRAPAAEALPHWWRVWIAEGERQSGRADQG
jgi:NAD-dependent deacetylase